MWSVVVVVVVVYRECVMHGLGNDALQDDAAVQANSCRDTFGHIDHVTCAALLLGLMQEAYS
jgi:hypothetical protein